MIFNGGINGKTEKLGKWACAGGFRKLLTEFATSAIMDAEKGPPVTVSPRRKTKWSLNLSGVGQLLRTFISQKRPIMPTTRIPIKRRRRQRLLSPPLLGKKYL